MKHKKFKILFYPFLLAILLSSCIDEFTEKNELANSINFTSNKTLYQNSDTMELSLQNNSDYNIIVGKRCNIWLEMTYQERKDGKWSSDKNFQYMYLKCATFADTTNTNSTSKYKLPCNFFNSTNTFRLLVPCYIPDKDTSIVVISNSFEIEKS